MLNIYIEKNNGKQLTGIRCSYIVVVKATSKLGGWELTQV